MWQHIQDTLFCSVSLGTSGVVKLSWPIIYGCERWTIKEAAHWRIDASELWSWRRLLRVLWTARRSNQFILKEINPVCSLVGLMLKLKLQYSGHLMWRADSFEKTLILGKIEGRMKRDDRGWDGWMASLTQWTWVWVDFGSWRWTGRSGVLLLMVLQRVRSDWTTKLNELKRRLWKLWGGCVRGLWLWLFLAVLWWPLL